jgi:hypothetical protein
MGTPFLQVPVAVGLTRDILVNGGVTAFGSQIVSVNFAPQDYNCIDAGRI